VEHDPKHYYYEVFGDPLQAIVGVGPAGPLLIFFFIYLAYFLAITVGGPDAFQKRLGKWQCCRRCRLAQLDTEVQQNIDNYWRCLDDDDRNWSHIEEKNCRENLRMMTMFDSAMQGLSSNRMGRCHLTGIHTYDILRNQAYWQAFQYIAASIPDRNKFIKDGDDDDGNNSYQSDLVRLVLNLSFLTEEDIGAFSFDKNLMLFRHEDGAGDENGGLFDSKHDHEGQEHESKDVVDFIDVAAHKAAVGKRSNGQSSALMVGNETRNKPQPVIEKVAQAGSGITKSPIDANKAGSRSKNYAINNADNDSDEDGGKQIKS